MSAPPPTCLTRVHSHRRCRRLRPPGYHPGSLVPPSWFLTTSTGFSACEVPGLLHPGTGRGSPRFRCAAAPRATHHRSDDWIEPPDALSRNALRTPRRSPPAGSRIASLRPLPPRRCASRSRSCRNRNCTSDPRPRGFAPPSGVVRVQAVASRARTLLPWASFPSRVPDDLAADSHDPVSRAATPEHPSHRLPDRVAATDLQLGVCPKSSFAARPLHRRSGSTGPQLRTLLGFVTSKTE
jgi:hypothetical protein